jgi:hypothetical protein
MHPVEEDGRFVNQPVYPDRQAVFCLRERSTKENNLLFQGQVKKCRAVSGRRRLFFRKLGPNVAKERAGVVLDHPNDPRVAIHTWL